MISRPRKAASVLYGDAHLKTLLHNSARQRQLLEHMRKLLPDPLGEHCVAASHVDQTLVLFTDSSAWASRLRFYSRELRHRLSNSSVPTQKIDVRVIPKHTETTSLNNKSGKAAKLSPTAAEIILQTADTIEDTDLRQALQRLGKLGLS
ncbi:MAG: DciA family protein [Chromatiales bacterium]|jgi:hypothetical protein